jgi:hypothetical protein
LKWRIFRFSRVDDPVAIGDQSVVKGFMVVITKRHRLEDLVKVSAYRRFREVKDLHESFVMDVNLSVRIGQEYAIVRELEELIHLLGTRKQVVVVFNNALVGAEDLQVVVVQSVSRCGITDMEN